jgi:hypothetical protein
MNERIKELKQAAGIDFNPDQEGLDLFAKLIVEECSNLVFEYGGGTDSNDGKLWDLANHIEKHFGAEL